MLISYEVDHDVLVGLFGRTTVPELEVARSDPGEVVHSHVFVGKLTFELENSLALNRAKCWGEAIVDQVA